MSQRFEQSVASSSFSDVQRAMRDALQHEKTDDLQSVLSTSASVLQQRGSELLPLALGLCEPNSLSSGKMKKFGFLNTAWKLLLTIMTSQSIDEVSFQQGASSMTQHLRTGVLSHDWTDVKKNKLATFFASHVVTAIRAHPRYALASTSLMEELVTLYYGVCVVLATSEREDASLQPLYDNIATRLHAIFACLGGAAGAACVQTEPEGATATLEAHDDPAAAEAKQDGFAAPWHAWTRLLNACVSSAVVEAVTEAADGGAAVDTAVCLAGASTFLHAAGAILDAILRKPVTVESVALGGERCASLQRQLAELLLSWLPGREASSSSCVPDANASQIQKLGARVQAVSLALPPRWLEPPRDGLASPDGASSLWLLWRAAFAGTLQALLHESERASLTEDRDGRGPDRRSELAHVVLLALHARHVDAAAAVVEAWCLFVAREDARRRDLAGGDDSAAHQEREPSSALVTSTSSFVHLLDQLLCFAEGLLRVRAGARSAADKAATAVGCDAVGAWCQQLSTQLCTLVACACTSRTLPHPPSTLFSKTTASGQVRTPYAHAARLADAIYAHIASNVECTIRAAPEALWAAASPEWLRTIVGDDLSIGVPCGPLLASSSATAMAADDVSGSAEYAWEQLQAALQRAGDDLTGKEQAGPHEESENEAGLLLATPLLSIPALLRQYRLAVAHTYRSNAHTGLPLVVAATPEECARLHKDLIANTALWKQLTEGLQRHARFTQAKTANSMSASFGTVCRYVAALLVREFAFLPLTPSSTLADGRSTRSEEVLMVCLRRWLQLAIPDEQSTIPSVVENEEEEGEVSGAQHRAKRQPSLDAVALEGAHSLLCFAEHNTAVPLQELRLSEVASKALMQLLDQHDDQHSDSATASFPMTSSSLARVNASLLPMATASSEEAITAGTWEQIRHALSRHTSAIHTDDDATRDPQRHRCASGDAMTTRPEAPHCAERYDALLAEMQACRRTLSTFLAAQKQLQKQGTSRVCPPTTSERARSPLPSQRSFGDAVPHHLRRRRGGQAGDGQSPSCSQTPPAHRSESHPSSPPPPFAAETQEEEEGGTAGVTVADTTTTTSLAAHLQSLVRLSTEALAAINLTHPTRDTAQLEADSTTDLANTASVVSVDRVERTNSNAPRQPASTQPPPSPWDSHSVAPPRSNPQDRAATLMSGSRTRTVPIVTLSSRSTPQNMDCAAAEVEEEEAEPEVIDVDM